MKIHIFICNYNAATKLERTLLSIKDCKAITPNINVAIVDNASKDGSKAIIDKLPPDYILLNGTNTGKAVAMNGLIKEYSEGFCHIEDDDLIMSLDSDIYLTQPTFFNTLSTIWSILHDKVSCLVCFQIGNSLFKRQFEWTESKKGFNYFCPKELYGYGIAGGAIIIQYKYWKAVGGYSEGKGIYGGNDGTLLKMLSDYMHKPICVIKELEVYHAPEDNMTYQAWKDMVHQEHLKSGKSAIIKGFYD
jgi:glycosyltransferase involved in cell wall biosynthesis